MLPHIAAVIKGVKYIMHHNPLIVFQKVAELFLLDCPEHLAVVLTTTKQACG